MRFTRLSPRPSAAVKDRTGNSRAPTCGAAITMSVATIQSRHLLMRGRRWALDSLTFQMAVRAATNLVLSKTRPPEGARFAEEKSDSDAADPDRVRKLG